MKRLFVHVEGPTEENFVNEILRPHLHHHGYSRVSARLMGNARQWSRRGGIRGWPEAKRGIVRHLREDRGSIDTTMVDYYGLPQSGANAWPGRATADQVILTDRAAAVEKAIQKDLRNKPGDSLLSRRFFPYVMMHEFEAMLFSDCTLFARGIDCPKLEQKFQAIAKKYGEPEKINDTPDGAPSKRIEKLVGDYEKHDHEKPVVYEKPVMGVLAALEIGLDKIRAACPHFNAWLTRLEEIPKTG